MHVARDVCLGIESLQAQAARFILADVPLTSSSPSNHPASAAPVISWIDLTTRLAVPEREVLHELSTAAARLAASAAAAPVPPPSDVRLCVTGSALELMWESNEYSQQTSRRYQLAGNPLAGTVLS